MDKNKLFVASMIDKVLEGYHPSEVVRCSIAFGLDEAISRLGPSGLESIDMSLTLSPNTEYYMGASSSPNHIVITKISGDTVFYRTYPYKADQRMQKQVAASLIRSGTETWIRTYGKYDRKKAHAMKKALAGGPGVSAEVRDFQPVRIQAVPSAKADFSSYRGGDAWYAAETYGGVGMQGDTYEINAERRAAERMKKDKNWEVLSVKDA